MSNKILIVVVGATAVGKTAAAIKLAQYFNTEIISADSRQFFREMSIGTAKPDIGELAEAQHHFINSHSVKENFNVGDFETEGLKTLNKIFKDHNIAVMAGGSGLYVKAVCEGFDDIPAADLSIRERLNNEFAEKGIQHLKDKLRLADPSYYEDTDTNNPQRVIRALEVFESTGRPFSTYRASKSRKRPFKIIKIGLNIPREQLYAQINKRVDVMIANGLFNEVKSLEPYRNLNALKTVGYTEVFDYLDGKTNLQRAIEFIKQHTRQFAKRQLTWFRKDTDIVWINPAEDDIIAVAEALINT